MLNHPPRRLRGLATAAIMATVMLVPASASLAMGATSAELDPSEMDIPPTQTSLDELRALVDNLSVANGQLRADNSVLRQNVDSLATERDRLAASLHGFDELYQPLEADRQLLFELRKDLPETRPEAEAQLKRIRSLALAADPARLGQLIDRVDDAAPAFLDWRFTQFTSAQAASEAYIQSGANAFDSTMEEFRRGVLMSVANRLDGILNVIDRLR